MSVSFERLFRKMAGYRTNDNVNMVALRERVHSRKSTERGEDAKVDIDGLVETDADGYRHVRSLSGQRHAAKAAFLDRLIDGEHFYFDGEDKEYS